MKPTNLPENPTRGVVRRTLQGMDGRISHVETLAARWSPNRIDDAIEKAVTPFRALVERMGEEIVGLAARLAVIEAQVAPVPAPMPQPYDGPAPVGTAAPPTPESTTVPTT